MVSETRLFIKFWKIFLRDAFSYLRDNKGAGLQSIGCNFTEKEVFDKKHSELTSNSRGDYY